MKDRRELTKKKKTAKKAISKSKENGKSKGRPTGQPKTGGRVKGSTNKKTIEVIETLAKMKCNPIEGMVKIAMDARSLLDNESLLVVKAIRELLEGKEELLEFFEMILKSWTHHSPELRAKMFSELAQYVFPKRKAVELSTDPNNPLTVEVIQRVIVDPKGK